MPPKGRSKKQYDKIQNLANLNHQSNLLKDVENKNSKIAKELEELSHKNRELISRREELTKNTELIGEIEDLSNTNNELRESLKQKELECQELTSNLKDIGYRIDQQRTKLRSRKVN